MDDEYQENTDNLKSSDDLYGFYKKSEKEELTEKQIRRGFH
jgi:hypothetical protein